jgi:hypothetical protein
LNRGNIFLLLIIILAHKIFFLVTWARIEGSFNVKDVALLLVWVGVAWLLFSGVRGNVLKNPVSWLVLSYLFFVAVHISLARFYYNQSLFDGIIAARNQFIYLVFFLFLILLDTPEKIARLLDYLAAIASVVLFLAVVNYFFPVVFHNIQYDEGWDVMRSGIRRAYVPSMGLISMAAVWAWVRWVRADVNRTRYGVLAIFLIAGHFFQQSRGPIIGLVVAIMVVSYLCRRAKELRYLLAAGVLGGIITAIVLPANLLLAPFVTAIEDVSQGSGTVKGRLVQLEHDIEAFMEHPLIGSGLVVVRTSEYSELGTSDMALNTRKADLGYAHWIKMYGISGVFWLGALFIYSGLTSLRAVRTSAGLQYSLALFVAGYLAFVVVTGVTVNHFLIPERITLFMLLAAIIVRLSGWSQISAAPTPEPEVDPSSQQASRGIPRRPRKILHRH